MHTPNSSSAFSMAGVCLAGIAVLVCFMWYYLITSTSNDLFPTELQQQHLRENRAKQNQKIDYATTNAITSMPTDFPQMAKVINENIDEPFPLYKVPKSARNRAADITAPTETEESIAYEAIDEEEDIATQQEFQIRLQASN